jgi:hypothetical protein
MEGVGHNRDRPGLEPKDHLDYEKSEDGSDRHPACHEAVLDADLLVLDILVVIDQSSCEAVVEFFETAHRGFPLSLLTEYVNEKQRLWSMSEQRSDPSKAVWMIFSGQCFLHHRS